MARWAHTIVEKPNICSVRPPPAEQRTGPRPPERPALLAADHPSFCWLCLPRPASPRRRGGNRSHVVCWKVPERRQMCSCPLTGCGGAFSADDSVWFSWPRVVTEPEFASVQTRRAARGGPWTSEAGGSSTSGPCRPGPSCTSRLPGPLAEPGTETALFAVGKWGPGVPRVKRHPSTFPDQVTQLEVLGRQSGERRDTGNLTELSSGADETGVSCSVTCAPALEPASDTRVLGVVTAPALAFGSPTSSLTVLPPPRDSPRKTPKEVVGQSAWEVQPGPVAGAPPQGQPHDLRGPGTQDRSQHAESGLHVELPLGPGSVLRL